MDEMDELRKQANERFEKMIEREKLTDKLKNTMTLQSKSYDGWHRTDLYGYYSEDFDFEKFKKELLRFEYWINESLPEDTFCKMKILLDLLKEEIKHSKHEILSQHITFTVGDSDANFVSFYKKKSLWLEKNTECKKTTKSFFSRFICPTIEKMDYMVIKVNARERVFTVNNMSKDVFENNFLQGVECDLYCSKENGAINENKYRRRKKLLDAFKRGVEYDEHDIILQKQKILMIDSEGYKIELYEY